MNPHVDKEDAGVAKLLGTVLAGKLLEVRVVQATVGCQALNEIFKLSEDSPDVEHVYLPKYKQIKRLIKEMICINTVIQ